MWTHVATSGALPLPLPTTTAGSPLRWVVYLPTADKYCRLTHQSSKGQKGLCEGALMASQRPSPPWGRPPSRPCARTSPAQAPSSGGFPLLGLLTPLLAAARAAHGITAPRAASRRDRSAPRPWQASGPASVWLSLCHWGGTGAG